MKIGIYGYGGHAMEVAAQMNVNVTFFVDDNFVNDVTKPISKFNPKEYKIIVAVANCGDRYNIVKKLPKKTKYFTYIHPTALIMSKNIYIGEGSFIGAYSILTTNIKIGKHNILNRANHIGHDSKLGNYVSMMPNSIISGNAEIGNRVYIGTNASIKEKINIVNDVTIGLNAGVIKDITKSGTYVGVPAKKIK